MQSESYCQAAREQAEATGKEEVLKALANVLEGTPQVQNLEVCNSTSHKIAAGAP